MSDTFAQMLVLHEIFMPEAAAEHRRRDSAGVECAVVRAAVNARRRARDHADSRIRQRRGIAVREIAALKRRLPRADNGYAYALRHPFYVALDEERKRHIAQISELLRIVLIVGREYAPAVLAANINNALRLFGRALPESFYLLIGEYTAQSPFYLAL